MPGSPRRPSQTPVERSVARVKALPGGELVGLSFALDEHHMVTCAHVVNAALGRATTDISPPPDDQFLLLELRAGSLQPDRPSPRYANVAAWLPAEGRRWFAVRDVAVLEVTDPLPPTVVRPALARGQANGRVCMLGPSPGQPHEKRVDGEMRGEVEVHLLQVDERLDNVFKVEHGFSGGPVWYSGSNEVAGMLVAGGRGQGPRDVYVVAAEVIDRAWGLAGVSRRPVPSPRTGPRIRRPAPIAIPRRPKTPQPDLAATVGWWLRWPGLLAVSAPAGLVGFALATGRVSLALSAAYGLRALAAVHAAGVAAGAAADLLAARSRRHRSDAADPQTAPGT